MSKATARKFSNKVEKEKKPSLHDLISADLKKNPGATATEIAERTGLAEGSVQWELTRYSDSDGTEIRYKPLGYERKEGRDRPAMTWRLTSVTNKPFARGRVRDLMSHLKDALTGHPDIAAEAAAELRQWARAMNKKK